MQPENIQNSKVSGVGLADDDSKNWELLKLMFFVHIQQLDYLDGASQREMEKTAAGSDKVAMYNDLIARINAITDKEKHSITVDNGSELEKLLQEAKADGVKINKTVGEFDDHERDLLIQNIRIKIESLNTENSLSVNLLDRLTHRTYTMWTQTSSVKETMHKMMMSLARAIKGN